MWTSSDGSSRRLSRLDCDNGLRSENSAESICIRLRAISSRFSDISTFKVVTPVRLPPGRLRLATSRNSTGSAPVKNTMGIVAAAAFAAMAAEVALPVAITLPDGQPARPPAPAGGRIGSRPTDILSPRSALDVARFIQAKAKRAHNVREQGWGRPH